MESKKLKRFSEEALTAMESYLANYRDTEGVECDGFNPQQWTEFKDFDAIREEFQFTLEDCPDDLSIADRIMSGPCVIWICEETGWAVLSDF